MITTRPRKLLAAFAITAVAVTAAGAAFAAGGRSAGPDNTYSGSEPFANASAVVQVVPMANGMSLVTLQVMGVEADAGRTFGAHVHVTPCGTDPLAAGGHYQHAGLDPTLPLVDREVWLDFTINAAGNGHAEAMRPWTVTGTANRSVIIHALPTNSGTGVAGPRLACIDLDS